MVRSRFRESQRTDAEIGRFFSGADLVLRRETTEPRSVVVRRLLECDVHGPVVRSKLVEGRERVCQHGAWAVVEGVRVSDRHRGESVVAILGLLGGC